jgi:hypothetical protein
MLFFREADVADEEACARARIRAKLEADELGRQTLIRTLGPDYATQPLFEAVLDRMVKDGQPFYLALFDTPKK